jgi:hypothetical protein
MFNGRNMIKLVFLALAAEKVSSIHLHHLFEDDALFAYSALVAEG